MKKYYFQVNDRAKDENLGEYESIELWGWYPDRTSAILFARWYSHEHEEYGLYVDWINEMDDEGNDTASIPFGDYELRMNGKRTHTWPWPEGHIDGIEYHWDEM